MQLCRACVRGVASCCIGRTRVFIGQLSNPLARDVAGTLLAARPLSAYVIRIERPATGDRTHVEIQITVDRVVRLSCIDVNVFACC
jgi:hypothetical protein